VGFDEIANDLDDLIESCSADINGDKDQSQKNEKSKNDNVIEKSAEEGENEEAKDDNNVID